MENEKFNFRNGALFIHARVIPQESYPSQNKGALLLNESEHN